MAEEEHCFDACKRDDAKARHHEAGRSWTAGLYDNDPYPVPTLTLHSDRGYTLAKVSCHANSPRCLS